MKHYHVLTGMEGGYMPSQNSAHATKREAMDCAIWEASDYRDAGYTVVGSAKDGLYVCTPPGASAHTLNDYIEIVECTETDCEL